MEADRAAAELSDVVETLVQRFEAAWAGQAGPLLGDFLTVDAAERSLLLRELVKVDLEQRWRRGATGQDGNASSKPLQLEDYVARYPDLGPLEELAPVLIETEYFVRHLWGDRPGHAEYAARFPGHLPGLIARLRQVDAEVDAELAPKVSPILARPIASPSGILAPPASVEELVAQLAILRLLRPTDLRTLREEVLPRVADRKVMVQTLLDRGWLTFYQVEKLLEGRAEALVIGPYRILEKIGEGRAGQVFKARQEKLGRLVALKILRPELRLDPDVFCRFLREMRLLSSLDHPHVIRALDAGPIGSHLVLVMEYAPGTDLHRLVREKGPLPVAPACAYIRQAALGLQHLHEHGLVHRDLKPSNLLLTDGRDPDQVVKILDLGLGRLHAADASPDSTDPATAPGVALVGTPDFLAPEQAMDLHQADIRSDIYSLGCTLFFLLVGEPPFPGSALADKLLRHQQAAPPTLRRLRPSVPQEVAEVVGRMLAKEPADRFRTPAEVVEALRPWCSDAPARPASQSASLTLPGNPSNESLPRGPDAPQSEACVPKQTRGTTKMRQCQGPQRLRRPLMAILFGGFLMAVGMYWWREPGRSTIAPPAGPPREAKQAVDAKEDTDQDRGHPADSGGVRVEKLMDVDIGKPSRPGRADYDVSGAWTITGGGGDVWGTHDQFHFANLPFSGDGFIVARVTTITSNSAWAKAGIMFRNSLEQDSMFAFVILKPAGHVRFEVRSRTKQQCHPASGAVSETQGIFPPVWLKLVKSGDTFSGYYAMDGFTWVSLGAAKNIPFRNNPFLAGLAVTAHDGRGLATATFSDLVIRPDH